MAGIIYVADKSAVFMFKGKSTRITANRTTVREGHPILESYGHLFRPLHIDYESVMATPPTPPAAERVVEEASDDPDRPRRRGRPPLPRDQHGNIVHIDKS